MSEPHNVLSLDVGERRIGVALASLEARLAAPLLTIDRIAHPEVFEYIKNLSQEHDAGVIIIGLPRGMNGQETDQTRLARSFAAELAKVFDGQIHMQDEAGTSIQAEEELRQRSKPYEKGDIDKLAATIILSDWLEAERVN